MPEIGQVYRKANPVRDPGVRREWALCHLYCQACWMPATQAIYLAWPGLETHHIVKFRRSDERTNFLRFCSRCHRHAEGLEKPTLTLGMCLALKQDQDPHEYDPARLAELRGSPLPDPEPLPQWFLDERERWR